MLTGIAIVAILVVLNLLAHAGLPAAFFCGDLGFLPVGLVDVHDHLAVRAVLRLMDQQ